MPTVAAIASPSKAQINFDLADDTGPFDRRGVFADIAGDSVELRVADRWFLIVSFHPDL